MTTQEKTIITVESKISAPVDKVWNYWTSPEHIVKWNSASEDWHTPRAENDLKTGGRFISRMESRDGKMGFDFGGQYTKVDVNKQIEYVMDDGRACSVSFQPQGNSTYLKETFEAESVNPVELQKGGWQSILDNFKKYVESTDSK